MADELKVAPELGARVHSVAALSSHSPAEVVAEAIEHGRSLGWQEHFVARVRAGIADADAGRYAEEAEFERLRNKYRST